MQLIKSMVAGLALAAIVGPAAVAADLPVRGPAPAPAPVFAGPLNWQGFYIGANVGYGAVLGDQVGIRTFPLGIFVPPAQGNVDSSGFFGGIQLGYNAQFGNVVAGVEIDAQLSGMRANSAGVVPIFAQTSASINWFGTLRGRLGYLITPNLLVYGTAGGAMTEVGYKWAAPAPLLMNATNHRFGWTAGGGIEYAIDRNWSVKGEALYVSTGKNTVVNTFQTFSTIETQSFWAARLGLNYRFGGPAGAVVARY